MLRGRTTLLLRLRVMGGQVLERPDPDDPDDTEALRADLRRLVDDVRRHAQRLNDLAYDQVELELGGSE